MAVNGVVSWRKMAEIDGEGGAHVLAVDDSLVDRKVIERLLKIFSCKVTVVDSGMRALQFLGLDEEKSNSGFNGLKVDLIITDYCMPGMTGYELLKKIKESSACREIPVVIMSSENVLTRIHRCLEEGAEDFIVKPVKLSDVERLKDYMGREAVKASVDDSPNGVNKRKFSDGGDENRPSSPASDSPSSESEPSSPPSVLPLSAPCSPSPPLCSPTRRLKMTVKES